MGRVKMVSEINTEQKKKRGVSDEEKIWSREGRGSAFPEGERLRIV